MFTNENTPLNNSATVKRDTASLMGLGLQMDVKDTLKKKKNSK